MDSHQTVIGVNLEAPKLQLGVIKGNKLKSLTETRINTEKSKKYILNQIISEISKIITKDVIGIGIGIPGAVDVEKGIVKAVNRIPSWKNVNIRDAIKKEFKIPCFLNNDANCFTLGVKYFGSGKKYKNIVGLILGEGIGAGIVTDNKLYSGATCLAGEFGMISYDKNNFEGYTSLRFFKNIHNTTFDDVYSKAEANDKSALRILKGYGYYLGDIMENIVLALNPELLVLGGEISKGFKYFEKSMWERLKNIAYKDSINNLQIRENQTENLTVLGAAALYYDAQQAKLLEIEKKKRKKAEQETKTILENVGEGIFLLNRSFEMSFQYSRQLEAIFETNELSGLNFLSYLKNKIKQDDLETTQSFLEFMFDDSFDEGAISDLNPLNPVELAIKQNDPKTLVFQFKRIQNSKGQTQELFVWVKDISAEKKLQEKINKTERKAKRQTELVLSIISVDPNMLQEFIHSVEEEFNLIDSYFDSNQKKRNYHNLLRSLYRSIHLLKGNAGILDLKILAATAHNFEEEINKILNQKNISQDDIYYLFNIYQDFKSDITEMQSLLFSIGELHSKMAQNNGKGKNALIKTLENYVIKTAQGLNKKVRLKTDRFHFEKIPGQFKILTKDLLIQMIRNSIAHGLEDPEQRLQTGKDETGNIIISTDFNEDTFSISVYDDGQGLQIEKLKQKMKDHSDWQNIEVDRLAKDEIIESIFHPGISTANGADMTSGRGVGMDAILQKIKSWNGSISVDSEELKYCKIKINLPNPN